MTDTITAAASPKTILMSVAGTLVLALVVLFAFVLPAEYGVDPVDPLRTGRLLGLTGLAEAQAGALTAQDEPVRTDVVEFELQPFTNVEYKYELAEGAGMAFSWSADGQVYYDMHSEPEDAEPGYAESFEIGTASRQDGLYHAPFSGIHGWFWENRGSAPVTVRLESSGFFTGAVEFRDGGAFPKDIPAE
jgi:hypothetical protein